MTRYLLAGLAMTASVVLLFLASFRPASLVADRQVTQPVPIAQPNSQPAAVPDMAAAAPSRPDQRATAASPSAASPPAAPSAAASPPAPAASTGPPAVPATSGQAARTSSPSTGQAAPSAAPAQVEQTKAVAALQEQIRNAAQTLAALENQVTQTRQDLASLKTQNGQAVPSSPPAASVAGAQSPRAIRRQGENAASPEANQGSGDQGSVGAGQGRGPDVSARNAPQPLPTERPQIAQAAGPAVRQRPIDLRSLDVRGPDPRTANTAAFDSQPDQRIPRPTPADPRADDDATQAALGRLRRQSVGGPVAPPAQPDRANEPHRVPTIERLEDARAAVVEGRIEDAKRYLQAAQVQLVFRPVGPGQDQPRVSQATGPVSQALLALNTGDRGRAIIAIDQAAGALNAGLRSQQFGSLPAGENTWLPPVARTGP